MRATLFTCAAAIAASVGIAVASPVNVDKRSSGLSCSKTVYLNTDKLGFGDDITGNTNQLLGMHTSNGGQQQVTLKTNGASTLDVNIRFCNSTHLGIAEDTEGAAFRADYDGYVSYGKIFLASDESKCLQRHATLPSSNPSQQTHISIEDCSNVDDATQARQFWEFQTKFGQAQPILYTNNKISTVPLVLSNDNPKAVLATRNAGNDNQQRNGLVF